MPRKIRLALFDVDGTLISAGGAGRLAIERAWLAAYGIRQAAEGIDFGGRTDASLIEELYRTHGLAQDPDRHALFELAYPHLLAEYLGRVEGRCLAGSRELLRSLRLDAPGVVVGLLTGNSRLAAEIKLRHFDLWDAFVLGAYGDDDGCRNRLASLAKIRAERYLGRQIEGEEVVVVGDTIYDVECAQSIGAGSLAVTSGSGSFEALRKAGASTVVRSLSEVSVDGVAEGRWSAI